MVRLAGVCAWPGSVPSRGVRLAGVCYVVVLRSVRDIVARGQGGGVSYNFLKNYLTSYVNILWPIITDYIMKMGHEGKRMLYNLFKT